MGLTVRIVLSVIVVWAGLSTVPNAGAETMFEYSGFIAGDMRAFPQDAIQPGQDNETLNPSLVLQPEFLWEWNNGDDRIEFIPFARLDSHDRERSHGDIRQLSYLHIADGWDLTVGIDKVFWGVMESRHLVDYINQTDAVEDVDAEEKLGQPMVNLGLQRDWGDLNIFYLPLFRERTFPGTKGRLRSPFVVATDKARYEANAAQWYPNGALRYAAVVGDWDIGWRSFMAPAGSPDCWRK